MNGLHPILTLSIGIVLTQAFSLSLLRTDYLSSNGKMTSFLSCNNNSNSKKVRHHNVLRNVDVPKLDNIFSAAHMNNDYSIGKNFTTSSLPNLTQATLIQSYVNSSFTSSVHNPRLLTHTHYLTNMRCFIRYKRNSVQIPFSMDTLQLLGSTSNNSTW